MPQRRDASSRREVREVQEPRPSSSVLLLSPTNEILLLHRVQTSRSFASAHVFPGGNLDAFHDGEIPGAGSPARHRDGPAYRMGAIRETFEETGILLATRNGALVDLSVEQRTEARKQVHGNEVRFGDFLQSIGAVADTAGLTPFTRWITPASMAKRFTTQMYLYQLPVSPSREGPPSEMLVPTADGGVEHTAAQFAPVQAFLQRAAEGGIVLFPPQAYLMALLGRFLAGPPAAAADPEAADPEAAALHYAGQRSRLAAFLGQVVTADTERGRRHRTAGIAWADKAICPYHVLLREEDGRVVLGLDKPGPELEGTDRGGDWERVALVKFGAGGPSDVEIRMREDVVGAAAAAAAAAGAPAKTGSRV
ncbi:uncharacterized protein UV8b_01644 [Ustilaginoidea virens]|uniref:Nudix hydrolase domain-containing protein n=1 Tax=Ustilaginoidea virens TaxID=1159556 RepID=A0A8E5MEK9_USTVR|nr:uncharacterized protein UV8b_01644 [Ustilaginoidea virens]QUC17403.1 hypothetical protein UV8b_01644 [Ustilaginoidea virens]